MLIALEELRLVVGGVSLQSVKSREAFQAKTAIRERY